MITRHALHPHAPGMTDAACPRRGAHDMTYGPEDTPLPVRVARPTPFLDRLPLRLPACPDGRSGSPRPTCHPGLGNCGIPGVMHYEGRRPGPHVVCVSLIHGNEFSGAIVLDRLLRARVRPARDACRWFCQPRGHGPVRPRSAGPGTLRGRGHEPRLVARHAGKQPHVA
ncbi:hypothetical protein RAA17_17290 [Komagataeibacter rhaeticus]|nr:hypothetical protein [Komagataeibacter rhaeticus]